MPLGSADALPKDIELAFAKGDISIFDASIDCACGESVYAAMDFFDFFGSQFTSAYADEYSIVLIRHGMCSSHGVISFPFPAKL